MIEQTFDQAPGGTLFRSKNPPRDMNSNESSLGKIVSERDAASVTSRDGAPDEEPGTYFYPRSFYTKRRLLVKTHRKVGPAVSGTKLAMFRNHSDNTAMWEGWIGSLTVRGMVKSDC